MEYDNRMSFEDVVNSDPTLKYLIRDSKFDLENLEHQVNIRGAAILIAINKWIDINYNIKSKKF